MCPKRSDPFYVVSYYIKWVTTSWTHSTFGYCWICCIWIVGYRCVQMPARDQIICVTRNFIKDRIKYLDICYASPAWQLSARFVRRKLHRGGFRNQGDRGDLPPPPSSIIVCHLKFPKFSNFGEQITFLPISLCPLFPPSFPSLFKFRATAQCTPHSTHYNYSESWNSDPRSFQIQILRIDNFKF